LSSPEAAFGRSGAFPRSQLQPDETVLFEGKPSMFATTSYGIFWFLMCLLGAALFLYLSLIFVLCTAVIIIVGIVPFIYLYIQWSATAFALTTKRVLVEKMDNSLHRTTMQLPLYNVTHTVRSQSFMDQLAGAGNIGFSAAAGMPGFMWPSVPGHDTVRAFVDEQLARYRPAAPQPAAYAPPPQAMYGPPGYMMPPAPGQYAAPAGRVCPSCRRSFANDAQFCPYCGGRA